ncbi:hypothetical protein ACFRAR_08290 [Kitasatospora sp. NPDC056651]|uniref:hypothetical protein n=1 Tax=Kitasatospora sp. NPDC056651 TaxID=3345892 RepID=UPI0036D11FF8
MIAVVRRVGFYSELDPAKPDLYQGSIRDAMGAEPYSDESELIGYLERGIELLDIMEACQDVISQDQYIEGCSSVLSDGSWIWRLDLPYYLKRYHLRLDPEFVEHVRAGKYEVPVLPQDELVSLAQEVVFNVLGMRH